MALVWFLNQDGQRYEVRSAGKTLRLYSNGVFHSQYHPNRPLLGGVWDLLYLAGFICPVDRPIKNIALLGLGGGAVVHPLLKHFQSKRLDAVELDPVHIQVAQQFFGVTDARVKIHQQDAAKWITKTKRHYDLIIDDLYGHADGEPERGVELDREWLDTLVSRLSDQGLLVINFTAMAQVRALAKPLRQLSRKAFHSGWLLSTEGYLNRVLVLTKTPITAKGFRQAVTSHLPSIDFRIQRLAV